MNSIVLEIPNEPSELPVWIERHLLGSDLATLVAELQAVHGPAAGSPSTLNELLGKQRSNVLTKGLAALNPQQMQQLLVRPELLLDLQELVLVEGGEHWENKTQPTPADRQQSARGERQLRRFIDDQAATDPAASEHLAPEHDPRLILAQKSISWYRRLALISLATAAAVLIGVFAQRQFFPDNRQVANPTPANGGPKDGPKPGLDATAIVIPKKQPSDLPPGEDLHNDAIVVIPKKQPSDLPPGEDLQKDAVVVIPKKQPADLPPGEDPIKVAVTPSPPETWGWAKPDALVSNDAREKYLAKLSEEGGEWFNQRPETQTTLAKRLLELRQGCSAMMFAQHKPLTEADKEWLLNRCRGWAESVGYQLADLENGEDAIKVRDKVDKLMKEIQRELTKRATA